MNTIHIVKRIILMIIMVAAFSAVVMLLWNWLLPALTGVKTISFLQATGLLVLARVLFGGWGGGFLMRAHEHAHLHHNAIHEKWMNMSPEERKEFIRHRHTRHKFHGFHTPTQEEEA